MSSHQCFYQMCDRCESSSCACQCHTIKRSFDEKPKMETRGRKRKLK